MKRQRVTAVVVLITIPFVCYTLLRYTNLSYITKVKMDSLVGIIAILSGITGIIMSFSSSRQANLDAVKEYYQQGDDPDHVAARDFIRKKKHLAAEEQPVEVSRIVNFYQMWGILNRKRYLPICVFGGASGIRVVELLITLNIWVIKAREKNPFYAKEFELLAYRIYRKYKNNFSGSNLLCDYDEDFKSFERNATSYKQIWSFFGSE